jgi:hypothetical protein
MPALPDASRPQLHLIVAVDRHRLAASIAPACHAFEHADLPPARRETSPCVQPRPRASRWQSRFHERSVGRSHAKSAGWNRALSGESPGVDIDEAVDRIGRDLGL